MAAAASSASAAAAPDEAESKTAHMNKDHRASLERFLEFYNGLPRSSAQGAELEEVTLSHLIIRSPKTRSIIPLEPALRDWSELRPRLVAMDGAALAGLGRSDVVVDAYVAPRGFHAVVMLACALTFLFFYRRGNFAPGAWQFDAVLHRVPRFATFCATIQPVLFPGMLATHVAEAVWLHFARLKRYNVPILGRLWCTWFASVFLEGIGGIRRFDALVQKKKTEKARAGY